MSPQLPFPLHRFIALPAILLMAGCTALDSGSPGADSTARRDPALVELGNGMQRCLENQAGTQEQLRLQQQQLERQQEQLEALVGEVRAASLPAAEVDLVSPVPGACDALSDSPDKLLVGQLETVWLQNLQLALPARIDTGAETASLDARNIELFERNGRRWVRFEIVHPQTGDLLPVERKLKRMVAIVQSNTAESERRPVIVMGITIGDIAQTAEFTLSNRSHLDYQVLVGRNILKDVMIVDVSKEHIAPLNVSRASEAAGATP